MSRRMGLAGSLGAPGLWVMAVAASAPLIVTSGGVTTMYAASGLLGVPAVFLLLLVALVPITASYAGAARHIGHAATSYALLSQGVHRYAGVAAGAVALLSYIAIGCSLYGLIGVVAAGLFGGAWWAWALIAWALVAASGWASITANVVVIGVGVALQLAVVAAVVWAALSHPAAGHITTSGLAPQGLFAGGAQALGSALVFGIACFVGYESPASYLEEKRPSASLLRASFGALVFLALCYSAIAWAVQVGYGPDRVVDVARDPTAGMPIGLLSKGTGMLATLVLLAALVLCMSSFHHLSTRHLFRLGFEGVLPGGLGKVGRGARAGAPTAASVVHSSIALVVIAVTVFIGADPYAGLFVGLSTLAAIGVIALLTASSWAAGRYFMRGGGGNEGVWMRRIAPVLGVLSGAGVLLLVVTHLDALLNVGPGAVSTRVLPALVVAVALLGSWRASWLRRHRPQVYDVIGRGQPAHAQRLDPRLAELKL